MSFAAARSSASVAWLIELVLGNQLVDGIGDIRPAFWIEGLQRLHDIAGPRHHDAAVLGHDEVQLVDELGVEGLVSRQGQGLPVLLDWDDAVRPGDICADGVCDLLVNRTDMEFDELRIEFIRDELQELVFGDDLVVVEDFLEVLSGIPAFLQDFLELLFRRQLSPAQDLPDHRHLWLHFNSVVVHVFPRQK